MIRLKGTPGKGSKSTTWPWFIFSHHILRQERCSNVLRGHIQTHVRKESMHKRKTVKAKNIFWTTRIPNAPAISQTLRSRRDAEEIILPTGCSWSLPSSECLFSAERESQILSHLFSSEDRIKVSSKGGFHLKSHVGGFLLVYLMLSLIYLFWKYYQTQHSAFNLVLCGCTTTFSDIVCLSSRWTKKKKFPGNVSISSLWISTISDWLVHSIFANAS